jgi:signal peptidase I
MKRAIGLIVVIAVCVAGFLSVRGALPFIPIYGHSMEPTLHSGNLLMIQPIDPKDVKVGDIIVYTVPAAVRDYYNYPPTVSHRVIDIWTEPSLSFRTKGDNTGEDPFTIMAQNVRGTVGKQIPYLGLPLLFFQSQQGMIFTIIALSLLALFMYGGELGRGGDLLHRGIFAPVIREEKRTSRELARKMGETEERMNATEDALQKFAGAVAEYAQHLASHTSAIQGLSEASHELKKGAAEQNQVLAALLDTINRINTTTPAGTPCPPATDTVAPEPLPAKAADTSIPGCARKARPWEVTPPSAS